MASVFITSIAVPALAISLAKLWTSTQTSLSSTSGMRGTTLYSEIWSAPCATRLEHSFSLLRPGSQSTRSCKGKSPGWSFSEQILTSRSANFDDFDVGAIFKHDEIWSKLVS